MEEEDSLHLWGTCRETRNLRGGVSVSGLNPLVWSFSQVSMFLREQTIADLLDRNLGEHNQGHPA